MKRALQRSVLPIALAVASFIAAAGQASAGQEKLLGCSSLTKAFERDDGSIVALGYTANCERNRDGTVTAKRVLIGLGPGGSLLPGFGDKGINLLADGPTGTFIERPDGGAILRAGDALISFGPDGRRDPDFGERGKLWRSGLNSAFGGRDEALYLWRNETGITRLAKFDFDGNPDDSFGDEGEMAIELPDAVGPAVDSGGRILFTQGNDAVRLLPDGSPDPHFGVDGRAEMDTSPGPPGAVIIHGISRIEVASGDRFIAMGTADAGIGTNRSFITGVDSSGTMLPGFPNVMEAQYLSTVAVLDDGVAYEYRHNRFDSLYRFKLYASGWLAPVEVGFNGGANDASVLGVTQLSGGSVLGVGQSNGRVCPGGKCVTVSRMVLAKVNSSGALDSGFGDGGKLVIPSNSCQKSEVSSANGDWKSCFIRAPRVRGSVEISGRQTANPGFLIEAGPGEPPISLGTGQQKISITLPGWLAIRSRARVLKSAVSTRPKVPVQLLFRGRRLTATVSGSAATTVRIRIPRGAIRIDPRIRRVASRKVPVLASFVPYKGSPETGSSKPGYLRVKTRP